MRLQFATRSVDVEPGARHVAGTWTADEHVVDRRRQLVEEPAEPDEVGGVESGNTAFELEAGALHALGVACRDDHLGSLLACSPSGLEADAGAATDHQERLPGELRVAPHHAASAPVPGTSMATAWILTSSFVAAM